MLRSIGSSMAASIMPREAHSVSLRNCPKCGDTKTSGVSLRGVSDQPKLAAGWPMSAFDWGAFWAAGFGAMAAFMLEAWRRWRGKCRADRDAATAAQLTLSQMYSHLGSILQDAYLGAHERTLALVKRNAHPYEMPTLAGVADHEIRLDIRSLAFLVGSRDPDLINVLAVVERRYIVCLINECKRVELYQRMQEILAAAGVLDPSKLGELAIDALLKPALAQQITSISRQSEIECRETVKSLLAVQDRLGEVAAEHFPMQASITFGSPEEAEDARKKRKAAWWRRALFSLRRYRSATWGEVGR